MILQVIASVFLIIAIAAFFGLTPERITDDMMSLMTPNDTMKDKARNIRGNKKRHGLYRVLVNIKGALTSTGKSKQFTIVICASVVFFAAGVIVSILINNLFLMPVLAVTFAHAVCDTGCRRWCQYQLLCGQVCGPSCGL